MKSALLLFIIFSLNLYCQSNPVYEPEELLIRASNVKRVKLTNDIYKSFDYKIRYGKKAKLKPINFDQNLANLSVNELRMLKYELYARKGYLFRDVVIRDYFNEMNWYQPIYWIDSLDFSLDSKEEAFYQKIKIQEEINTKKQLSSEKYDLSQISNKKQLEITDKNIVNKLQNNGFAVIKCSNIELFETYEINRYQKFPSFVTTDFYLQLMHLYFSNILTELETTNFIPLLTDLTKTMYDMSSSDLIQSKDTSKEAAFSQFYFAVAFELVSGNRLKIQNNYENERKEYFENIKNHEGVIQSELFLDEIDFSLFKPRGHYLLSKELSRYFRAMMWLSKMPFDLDSVVTNQRAQYIAWLLTKNKRTFDDFHIISTILEFLIGTPNNLSLHEFWVMINRSNSSSYTEIKNNNIDKINQKGILANNKKRAYFFSQLYTPDANILNEMINLTFDETRREFPKSLDVFAVFGNQTAQDILINYYNEAKKWPGYLERLYNVKKDMSNYDFTQNSYGTWLNALNKVFYKDKNYPILMKKNSWGIKNLNSALASYAELKHDAILYSEQPSASEGDGDEDQDSTYSMPPDPTCLGYVEPNVAFWQSGLDFLNYLKLNLTKNNINNKTLELYFNEMHRLNEFLLNVSKKELAGKTLSENEYLKINSIGTDFEDLKSMLKFKVELNEKKDSDSTNDWEPVEMIENDDEMAIVGDVFTTNDMCLELGVGRADDIYCIVDIGGYNYLTRGSVFSFYEFKQPSSDRLTDQEWRDKITENIIPDREGWYKDILFNEINDEINILNIYPKSLKEYHGTVPKKDEE